MMNEFQHDEEEHGYEEEEEAARSVNPVSEDNRSVSDMTVY